MLRNSPHLTYTCSADIREFHGVFPVICLTPPVYIKLAAETASLSLSDQLSSITTKARKSRVYAWARNAPIFSQYERIYLS